MKTSKFILLGMLLLAMLAAGCSSDDEQNGTLRTRSIENSGCKNDNSAKVQSRASEDSYEITEAITLTAIKGGWLRVEHKNVLFPCCNDKIAVQVSMEDHLITVQEDAVGKDDCNCICPYDVNYEIGRIAEDTYTLVVNRGSSVRLRKEISYNENYNETIVITTLK